MSQIINPMLYGSGDFTLIFKDGHTETIPMSKVHINMNGVTTLPENCYPIVFKSKNVRLNSGLGYKFATIRYGARDDSSATILVFLANERNDNQGNTRVLATLYTPIACNDLEELKNGKIYYVLDTGYTTGEELFYVFAEK